MATLQELCLNTIENNGTSVREVLRDTPVSKKFTHRHPVLSIVAEQRFDVDNYPGLELHVLETEVLITVEFDGVYTLRWTRTIQGDDDEPKLTKEEYMAKGLDETLATHLSTGKTIREMLGPAAEFLKERHPDCPVGKGEMTFDLDTVETEVRREDPCGKLSPMIWNENKIVDEVKKMVKQSWTLWSSILDSTGVEIMTIHEHSNEDSDEEWDVSSEVWRLQSALNGLRRLSICY